MLKVTIAFYEALVPRNPPVMDFLNTSLSPRGKAIELIGDGQSFVAWLVSAGLLDASTASKMKRRFRAEALDAVASEARKLREWAGDWISRWRDAPGGNYETEAPPPDPAQQEPAKGYREVVVNKDGYAGHGALPHRLSG